MAAAHQELRAFLRERQAASPPLSPRRSPIPSRSDQIMFLVPNYAKCSETYAYKIF